MIQNNFRLKDVLIIGLLIAAGTVNAQKTIDLYEGIAPGSIPNTQTEITNYFKSGTDSVRFITKIVNPTLTIYLPSKEKNTGIAVIICPGGGYTGVAIDHEGHDIAKRLQANGIAGFVLKYRMPDDGLVTEKEFIPLMDAQRAIQLVRENAKLWRLHTNRIGIMGSSAGGHLASTAGTHYTKTRISNKKNTSLRPDFLVLNYPVISFADSLTHHGSRFNLIGEKQQDLSNKNMDHRKIEYSGEQQVNAKTPPSFLTHAVDDKVVKVQNSLVFIAALQKHKVPVESFFYANGGHGYGMNNPTSNVQWFEPCVNWIKRTILAPIR